MRLALLLTLVGLTGSAWGGAALDDAGKPQRTTDPNAAPDTTATADQVEYGADLRLRDVFIPSWMLNLFMDSNPGGVSMGGIGFDFVRRRGNVELQLGFETERIEPKEGVYVNGDFPSTDFILNPDHAGENLRWYTIEFTFLNHAPINKYLAVRYGGGAGLGILSGGVKRIDTTCSGGATKDNPVPGCVPTGYSYEGQQGTGAITPDNATDQEPNPYNLPPVFPVVNAIIGLQIKPAPKAVINIEAGIRTLPFIGVSAGYFFN
jgi:hypothetical protein